MQKLLARSPTGLGGYLLRTTKRRDLAGVACGLIFSGMRQQEIFFILAGCGLAFNPEEVPIIKRRKFSGKVHEC